MWLEKCPLATVSPSLVWIMGTVCTVADQEYPVVISAKSHVLKTSRRQGAHSRGAGVCS